MKKNILFAIIIVVLILVGFIFTRSNNKPVNIVEPAVVTTKNDLAQKLGINEKDIAIMQVTDMTWNDSCLGLGGPAESCLQVLVPGFKVTMSALGKNYVYRTDKTGSIIRTEIQF